MPGLSCAAIAARGLCSAPLCDSYNSVRVVAGLRTLRAQARTDRRHNFCRVAGSGGSASAYMRRVGGPGRTLGRAGHRDARRRRDGPARPVGREASPVVRPAAGPAPGRSRPLPGNSRAAQLTSVGHRLPHRDGADAASVGISRTVAIPAGSRERMSSAVPRTRSETSRRQGACAIPESTRAAGSNAEGASKVPARAVAFSIRSSRKVRTSPLAESAPATYQRAEWATIPISCHLLFWTDYLGPMLLASDSTHLTSTTRSSHDRHAGGVRWPPGIP